MRRARAGNSRTTHTAIAAPSVSATRMRVPRSRRRRPLPRKLSPTRTPSSSSAQAARVTSTTETRVETAGLLLDAPTLVVAVAKAEVPDRPDHDVAQNEHDDQEHRQDAPCICGGDHAHASRLDTDASRPGCRGSRAP